MKKMKKVVDERQELELYKIEHLCFWIVFWLLLGSIIVQSMFLNAPFSQWGFEWTIFMISCGGVIVGCYKKGQWDFYSKPTTKNYLIYSLIGAGAFAIIYAITLYMNHAYLKGHLAGTWLTDSPYLCPALCPDFRCPVCQWHPDKKTSEKTGRPIQ